MILKVVDISEQPNPRGAAILKIKVMEGEDIYTFGVRKRDYLDDQKRKSFQEGWFKIIRAHNEDKEDADANTEKGRNAAKKLDDLKRETVEEEYYGR